MQLPPKYVQLLQATNGLGIALDEVQFICGTGSARARWDDVLAFQYLEDFSLIEVVWKVANPFS